MMSHKNIIILVFVLNTFISFSQEQITKKEAVKLALENNYGILIAKNNQKIAENNASVFNSGYLPKVIASTGANYYNNNTENTLQNGTISKVESAESKNINASIGLNYTIFDGFGRSYNYKKLQQSQNLSELEVKDIIENSLLQIFAMYYEVARLTEDSDIISESLNISKQRLKRANYAFEYGQTTKLQLLNAEVDVNNDSIQFINIQRLLANSKRDLNLLLGRNISINFSVETKTSFNHLFELQSLFNKAKVNNVAIQKLEKNIQLNKFDIQINKSDLLPTLSFNSSYGFNKSDNDATFIYANQLSKGLNAGLSLNWNVFDGGTTKTRIENSKIVADNLQIQKEQIETSIERSIANALEIYNNSLFIVQVEEKNVITNQRNFTRTEEQFKLGQITSIEFRQAQINLLNAQSNLNNATYVAKNAELLILQLSGELLSQEF